MTTKISARDTIQAIARYAFLASSYPIILSLEIHCGVIQQDKLVEELIEAFGDRLVVERIDNEKGEEILRLPSPEDLRGKVLLKVGLFLFPYVRFSLLTKSFTILFRPKMFRLL